MELHLDKTLSIPPVPVTAWVFDIEPITFDPSPVGTPTITSGVFFGTSGGPFFIPGLTFGAFGPTPVSETLVVGSRMDVDLDGMDPIERVLVVGPGPELMSGSFEMLDATRFEIRNLVVSFSGSEVVPLEDLLGLGQPGTLTVTTIGQIQINLSAELEPLIQLLWVDENGLSWTASPSPNTIGYDAVRGDLDVLSSTAGDFTAATEECLQNNLVTTSLTDNSNPLLGTGHWTVVRRVTATGNGSYDSLSDSQALLRDALINSSPFSCP